MMKILMQKLMLLAASAATGYLMYKIFGEKIGNGVAAGGRTLIENNSDPVNN